MHKTNMPSLKTWCPIIFCRSRWGLEWLEQVEPLHKECQWHTDEDQTMCESKASIWWKTVQWCQCNSYEGMHKHIQMPSRYLTNSGAHQMEPPYLLISWVNPFPRRFINRTIFFCNALESHECACCLLSFLYVHRLFPLSARETSPGNRSIYKSTRERVDSKGLHGRCRLHLMGSWQILMNNFVYYPPPSELPRDQYRS